MYLDPNDEYAFVLQWIQEAKDSIRPRLKQSQRNQKMYEHKPSRNTYKEQAKKFDQQKALNMGVSQRDYDRYCSIVDSIPNGRSDIVYRSIETNVNQLSGGIGQFETTILDKSAIIEDNLEQIISLVDEQVYYNYLDRHRDMITRELFLYGASYVYPLYNKEAKEIEVRLISQDKMILDPTRFRQGCSRYIGFHKMISWQDLEKQIEFQGKFLKTKNAVKVYAKNLEDLMNAPAMRGGDMDDAVLKSDIINCYTDAKYTSNATTPEAKAKSKYQGLDVEVTYIWDLKTGSQYTVVNRRFIVDEVKNSLDVVTTIAQDDPAQGVVETRMTKRIKSPIIEIVAKTVPNSAHPVTALDLYGDLFDEICSLMSMKTHNESIVGTVTPYGSEYDLALLANGSPVSGVGVPGMDGTVGFLNKQYNADFVDTRIQEREQRIVQALNAYSQMDMVQMIGDRATAKESGAAVGSVAAGHNSLIHTLEIAFADIIRNVNLLTVRHMSNKTIKVSIEGELPTVNIQALALDAILNVRLKSEVEKERESKSLIAAQMLNIGSNNPYINQNVFIPRVLKIAFGTLFSREELSRIVQVPEDKEGIALAQQHAQNHAKQLQLQQQVVDQYPMERLQMQAESTMTPEDMELLTQELNADQSGYGELAEGYVNPMQYSLQEDPDGTMDYQPEQDFMPTETNTGELAPSTQGLSPEMAGLVSNGTEI